MPPYQKSKPLSKVQYDALKRKVAREMAMKKQTYHPHGARLTGKGGAYYSAAARYLTPYARVAGRTAARVIGSAIGGYAAKRYDGHGAYFSNAQGKISQMMPTFGNGSEETTVIFREYLGDIISSATLTVANQSNFKIDQFEINPGLISTFPWLSQIAENFQMYKLEQCVFEFRTFSGDSLTATNTALGAVVCAVDYDSSSAAFTTRQQMENSAFSMSAKPSESFMIPVECANSQSFSTGKLYVRNGAPPANTDLKTYDVGRLSIATQGLQAASVNVGSLYIAYKVRLFKPILLRPASGEGMFNIPYTSTSGITTTTLFGTASPSFNNIGATISGNVLTVPRKYLSPGSTWVFMWNVNGSSTAAVTAPGITTTVFSGVDIFSGADIIALPNPTPSTSGSALMCVYLSVPSALQLVADATITLTDVTLPTSITSGICNLAQLNSDWVLQ